MVIGPLYRSLEYLYFFQYENISGEACLVVVDGLHDKLLLPGDGQLVPSLLYLLASFYCYEPRGDWLGR
jgi:hypothetical protein